MAQRRQRDILEAIQAGITALQADVGTLKADVGTLKTDVGTLKADVGVLQDDMRDLRTRLIRLDSKVDQTRDQLSAQIARVHQELAGRIGDLEGMDAPLT